MKLATFQLDGHRCVGIVAADEQSIQRLAVDAGAARRGVLAIVEVKRSDMWCVALDPRGEMPAWEFDLTQRVCLVVGSEGAGVHRLVKERCDVRLRLPVKGHIASFNASAAAAALLYEVMRQRAISNA